MPPNYGVVLLVNMFIITLFQSRPNFTKRSQTTWAVIIFVRLATCLYIFSYFANITSPVFIFIIIQLRAETKGAGLSRLKYFVIDLKYSL